VSTHIVVACDPAREALEAARRLADPDDRITVVHAVNPLEEPWGDRDRATDDAVALGDERRRGALVALPCEVGLQAEVVVEPLAVDEGTAPGFARIARRLGADLLIVVSKRASGLRGMLLGSVAQGLLALSPCPVLVARPRGDAPHAPAGPGR